LVQEKRDDKGSYYELSMSKYQADIVVSGFEEEASNRRKAAGGG
jgi:hypothetical protein